MAPFIVDNEGKAFNESLDIIERFDTKNALKTQEYKNQGPGHEFLALISEPLFQLSMPYMWKYGEFDDANKLYFQKKKEVKRGSLAALQKQRPQYEALILTLLAEQEANLVRGFFQSETLTLNDILVASHLWCLYMVTEFQFPSKWHEYLQRVKRDCHFDFDRELFNS
jgi:glutaredoxin 2